MENFFKESINIDLRNSKKVWGEKRLEVAFYISMTLGLIQFILEILTKGLFSNLTYKLVFFTIYTSFIYFHKKIKTDPSKIERISFLRGEAVNLALMYYYFSFYPECGFVTVQLSSFVVMFYQGYIFTDVRSIALFSIKHVLEWTLFGIYFSEITINNVAHMITGIVACQLFMFACTYFDYLQDLDVYYSKKSSEIAVHKLDALVEAINDSIFVINSDLQTVFLNSSSRLLLQKSSIFDYLNNLTYQIRYEKSDSDNKIIDDIKNSFKNSIGSHLNFGVTEQDQIFIEWSGKVVIWENKVMLILFGKQVTRLVKLEKESRENQYKSALLRTVSHELRTPTNAMLVMAQLIKETGESSEENTERLDLMISSCTYLLGLINDLLDYSQIMAGILKVSLITFDVHHLFEECLKLIEIQLIGSSITLQINYISEVPKLLVSDPYRLKQIVLNLLSNARKFTIKGSIILEVVYTNSSLIVSCKDTGIGISPEKIPDLFTEFGKINDSHLNPQGVGLGLYISNMLTYELGGNGIKVASETGKGSCFSFNIEAKVPRLSSNQDDVPDENPKINFPNIDIRKIKENKEILIVDDTYFNVLAYMQILKKDGYKVNFVTNGKEAVEQVKKKEFLCVLMDCEMPVLDGWEATKILRGLEKRGEIKKLPPIIGCSAHNSEEIKQRCMDSGMDDYILKPCPQEVVLQKIKNFSHSGG